MAEINDDQLAKIERFFELIGNANDALSVQERELDKKQKDAERRRAEIVQSMQKVSQSLSSFAKASLDSSTGMSKYSGAVSSGAEAVSSLASKAGLAVAAFGALVKVIGSLVSLSFQQNDKLLKTYRDLSAIGTVTEDGLEGLQQRMTNIGLVTEQEYEKYLSVLRPITKELAMFGGSVSDGRNKLENIFTNLVTTDRERETQLLRLGYTVESYQEGIAEYIQLQTRLGSAQRKTATELNNESYKYLKTVKELEELTGLTRDEQAKRREQILSDARADIYYAKLVQEGRSNEAENFLNYMMNFTERYGKDAAQGLQDMLMSGGRVTTDAAAALFQVAPNAYKEALQAMNEGKDYFNKALQNTGETVMQRTKQLEGALMLQRNNLKEMGLSDEMIIGAMQSMGIATDVAAVRRKKMNDIEKKSGDMLAENIAIEQRNRSIRVFFDNLLIEVTKMVIKVFSYLHDITFKLVKAFAQAVDWITSYIPGVKATNYADQFKDSVDLSKNLETQKKITNITKELLDAREKELKAVKEGTINYATAIEEARKKHDDAYKKYSAAGTTFGGETKASLDVQEEFRKTGVYLRQLEEMQNMSKEQQIKHLENKIKASKEDYEKERKKQEEINKLRETRLSEERNDILTKLESPSQIGAVKNTSYTTDILGQQAPKEVVERREATQKALPALGQGREKEILDKLNFGGKKAERTGGGDASPALLAIAEKIKETYGDGVVFTALNDEMHHKLKYKSKHTVGKALDFVLPKNMEPKNAEEARYIKEQLKDFGATKVLDEYFEDKSSESTGRHFHLEVAKYGGLFNGPDKGYPVMLHGKNESAWPEAELKKLLKDVQKSSLSQYKDQLMAEMGLSTPTTETGVTSENTKLVAALNTFNAKLDDVISRLDKSNNIQDELLTYTRA